jgi:hypothetical protein
VYERLIPDPREELMGNEWDVIDEHPGVGGGAFPSGAAPDDDIERAILESMKHHNDYYGGSSSNVEDEILARVLEESKKQAVKKGR